MSGCGCDIEVKDKNFVAWIMWNIIPIMGDTEAELTAPVVDGGGRGPRGVTISES